MEFFRKHINMLNKLFPAGKSYYVWLLLSACCYLFVGYGLDRTDFYLLLAVYVLLFVAYVFLLRQNRQVIREQQALNHLAGGTENTTLLLSNKSDLRLLLGAAMAFRLLFLFSTPTLSDDYFRFAWDGALSSSGINPFATIPVDYLSQSSIQNGYLQTLLQGMNSPAYHTIYPPVCQYIFGLSAWLFPENLKGSIVIIRLFCIAADAGTLFLLLKMLPLLNLPKRNVLMYAFNPLVVTELSGNLHPEVIMLFFLMLAVLLLVKSGERSALLEASGTSFSQRFYPFTGHQDDGKKNAPQSFKERKLLYSAMAFSAAIASKLIPLLFLPFLVRRLRLKQQFSYYLVIAAWFLLLLLPFINRQLVMQWGSSLRLYFQNFEFNASVYYLVRWLGFKSLHYDIIQQAGPWFAAATFLMILWLAWREKDLSWKHFVTAMQWSLTVYLLLATTVHPWYVTTLVFCAAITGFSYPLVWSFFIILSYATYQSVPYRENLFFVFIEYTAVGSVMLLEILQKTNHIQWLRPDARVKD